MLVSKKLSATTADAMIFTFDFVRLLSNNSKETAVTINVNSAVNASELAINPSSKTAVETTAKLFN